jgi:hypothetical protein
MNSLKNAIRFLPMKGLIFFISATLSMSMCLAQPDYYDINPGNGHGVRFWANNNYKIDMGNGADYWYGLSLC